MLCSSLPYVLVPGAERLGVMEPLQTALRRRGVNAAIVPLTGFDGIPEDLRTIQSGEWVSRLRTDIQGRYEEGQPLVLVGHSLGGNAVIELAADLEFANRNPIVKVVGVCSAFSLRRKIVRIHDALIQAYVSNMIPLRALQRCLRFYFGGSDIRVYEQYASMQFRFSRKVDQEILHNFVYATWPIEALAVYLQDRAGALRSLGKISEILTLVEADNDPLCAPAPRKVKRLLKQRHRIVPGTHFLPLEAPNHLADVILI